MQENRFWFGKELYEHCIGFHAALHGICTSFWSNDFEKLEPQLLRLDQERQDVLMTLHDIRLLPRTPQGRRSLIGWRRRL
jgi:hypothetical protein